MFRKRLTEDTSLSLWWYRVSAEEKYKGTLEVPLIWHPEQILTFGSTTDSLCRLIFITSVTFISAVESSCTAGGEGFPLPPAADDDGILSRHEEEPESLVHCPHYLLLLLNTQINICAGLGFQSLSFSCIIPLLSGSHWFLPLTNVDLANQQHLCSFR